MSVYAKALTPPPSEPEVALTPAQSAGLEKLIAHFNTNYTLDGDALKDEEKIWLVS